VNDSGAHGLNIILLHMPFIIHTLLRGTHRKSFESLMFVSKRRIDRIKKIFAQRQNGLVIVLEDTHDPYNAEAILRTCEAFGVQDVHFIFENHPYFNPWKKGKAVSASANKWLTLHTHKSTEACLDDLKGQGYKILATVMEGEETENLFSMDLTFDKTALVLGAEKDGVTDIVKNKADIKINIPMKGMVQSLNLSVTAAIMLFEITRQREDSAQNYSLTVREQRRLIKHYLRREYARVMRKPFSALSKK
jgi:tRNA (guanosine-2'-O-)-methyltransferase